MNFGMTRFDVNELIGLPEKINNQHALEDGFANEIWHYLSRGIHLSFDPLHQFRLCSIKVINSYAQQHESNPIGKSESNLLSLYPNATLVGAYKNIKEYEDTPNQLEFHLVSGVVTEVRMESDPSFEFYRYCSTYFQRRFTCKRLLKNQTRSKEREVASILAKLFSGHIRFNDYTLASAIEWFLGAYLSINPETRALWCDGIQINNVNFLDRRIVKFNATADILSSVDYSAYDSCKLTGKITVSATGKKLQAYNLFLSYRDQVIHIKKQAL